MGCEAFDPRVSLVVIQKGFKKSWVDGWQAIGQEGQNAVTRIKEILAPETADFNHTYANINRRLHWKGDRLSVEHHLRRYTVWLEAENAVPELIWQSRLDQEMWEKIEKEVLGLEVGQAIQWLALKTVDPTEGVALQQIKNENGVLKQSSKLLPFSDLDKIERFLTQMGNEREEISVAVNEEVGLSPVAGWIVKGESIDFKQELPDLIEAARRPKMTEFSLIDRPPILSESALLTFTDLSDVGERGTGFWWEATEEYLPARKEIFEDKINRDNFTDNEEIKTEQQVNQPAIAYQSETTALAEKVQKPVLINQTQVKHEEPVIKEGRVAKKVLTGQPASQVAQGQDRLINLPLLVERQPLIFGLEVMKSKDLVLTSEILVQEQEDTSQNYQETDSRVKISEQETFGFQGNLVREEVYVIQDLSKGELGGARKQEREVEEKKIDISGQNWQEIKKIPAGEIVEEKITVSQVNRDKTVLPIWEIRMQGISLDDIPEWNLSSVLIGEDLGWSMTVPGLKAEEELETNAERAFKFGKWSEFDYLKKTVEVVETILLVIVNTNWEQPPRLRRRVVKDFGGDWGSGSVKYRQIQR